MLNEKSLTGHVVVIGAGVMGAGIAALMANIGWRVSLLDRVPEDAGTDKKQRNRLAQEGLDKTLKSRPPQFALPEYAVRVRVGNTEDNLDWVSTADWVVEAVAEDPAVKRKLLAEIAALAEPETVVSSNTSGLGLLDMTADCPGDTDFQRQFLGTHFFNPPRYMKPLELIPTAETSPEVFEGFVRFADHVLGKRVIRARDTPGFISTRLGMYALAKTIELAVKHGLTVEEADYLTGPLMGRPKSGSFRLADVVGLDITAKIIDNLKAALPHDRWYQTIEIPDIMRRLIAENRVGAKTGSGFYRREKSGEILSLDLNTGDYRTRQEPTTLPDIEPLALGERLRSLWALSETPYGSFLREMLRDTLGYMADVTPEVADRIVEVDDALMGGFGWEIGPFHILDALGAIQWPEGAPELIQRQHKANAERFYYNTEGKHFYFDFASMQMKDLPRPADALHLKDLKKAGRKVKGFEGLTPPYIDLGEGVLCVDWQTKMGALDISAVGLIDSARRSAEAYGKALVIAGNGNPFCAGYDLNSILELIEKQEWKGLEVEMERFQQTCLGLKYASVPIVCATSGYALGGGCEILLHSTAVQAAFESSIGLPEANVGLIPTGGGTTQMLLRTMTKVPPGTLLERSDPFPLLRPIWDNLRRARFSSSADEARAFGYLREQDSVTRHPDRLLYDAREHALALALDYRPSSPATVLAMGEDGMARFKWELHLLRRADQISAHDARIAEALATVFCGGGLIHPTEITEQRLLDLEREVFLSLAGTPETLARIKAMLETGRPLRN